MNKLFINIGELLTMDYDSDHLRGKDMNNLHIIKDAYLLLEDGKVASYGYMKDFKTSTKEAIDCKGKLVTPGIKTRRKKKWSDKFIVSKRSNASKRVK